MILHFKLPVNLGRIDNQPIWVLGRLACFCNPVHAVSIRSSNQFCLGKTFFQKSYILKFPGSPLKCRKCTKDLLIHHFYHFDSHENCRFCKQSWYKIKATSEKELTFLEKDETEYLRQFVRIAVKDSAKPILPRSMLSLSLRKPHSNVNIVKEPFILTKPRNIMR